MKKILAGHSILLHTLPPWVICLLGLEILLTWFSWNTLDFKFIPTVYGLFINVITWKHKHQYVASNRRKFDDAIYHECCISVMWVGKALPMPFNILLNTVVRLIFLQNTVGKLPKCIGKKKIVQILLFNCIRYNDQALATNPQLLFYLPMSSSTELYWFFLFWILDFNGLFKILNLSCFI